MEKKARPDLLPVGPLMIEHRLIERVVALLERESSRIRDLNRLNLILLNAAIDFFKVYADRCHHGKEEDILFFELKKKSLSEDDKKMIEELIRDHVFGRGLVSGLASGVEGSCRQCDPGIIKSIDQDLGKLTEFYRAHIEKEDKRFFIPAMKYLTEAEQADMLCRFREFDRELFHGTYKDIVSQLEKGSAI